MDFIFSPLELFKAIAANIGEVREWADGPHKKISPTKWIKVAELKTEATQMADIWRKAQKHFDYAMTSSLGSVLDDVLLSRNVNSFDMLVEKIKGDRRELASEIYHDVLGRLRRENAPLGWKKDLADNVGRSLLLLRDHYTSQPKARATITKVNKKTGKKWWAYEEGKHSTALPVLKASAVKAAKQKVGRWTVTGTLKTEHIGAMLENGTAKLTMGEPKDGKAWVLPKKAEDIELKYKGDSLLIRVKQVDKKKQRTRATAKVEIALPYAMAKAFLMKHIKSERTRNNFIFRMERSQGYRKFLEESAS